MTTRDHNSRCHFCEVQKSRLLLVCISKNASLLLDTFYNQKKLDDDDEQMADVTVYEVVKTNQAPVIFTLNLLQVIPAQNPQNIHVW